MKYENLMLGILLGGTPGMMWLFAQGHTLAGYWISGLICGLSLPAFYNFIREMGEAEDE